MTQTNEHINRCPVCKTGIIPGDYSRLPLIKGNSSYRAGSALLHWREIKKYLPSDFNKEKYAQKPYDVYFDLTETRYDITCPVCGEKFTVKRGYIFQGVFIHRQVYKKLEEIYGASNINYRTCWDAATVIYEKNGNCIAEVLC